MREQERQVNLQLHALDDAHRTGRMPRDEYRLRRRLLLASLSDDPCETGRDTVRRPARPGEPAKPAGAARAAHSRGRTWAISLTVLGSAICAGLALFYWLVLRAM
jgi:hypothetical protein